ncbi:MULTISPECIES: metal ABC transporter solute-binding protein, Zn/Mn family [Metabacillus]|uniref:Zinc ABC transporter substrate-binding protein n=1 Tax=Metabacillus rhizolycopersici TaxID=2875709 RepID=A0ABS7UTG1_9BACI|nr:MULTISPECIES: zinc ABC transporter substrate-binding protein [Metabacillus]MBZ5751595.1 zinc ABC transporter substrate-binding protein [Metabacillus rhizolycopersici]MCM3650869.1 zinc ABC transporter substrate-binding protein [Metabacillus litoralis]
MKKWILSVVVIVGLCLLAACGSNQATNNESGKIVVTTTTGQVADVVKNVGGDKVDVISLMGPGIDPHLYRASQGDIKKLNDAEIIFYNGVHLEGKMEDIFEKMSKGKPTVAVADSIPADQLLTVEGSNSHDPHVWFDIPAWIHVVDTVEQELTKLSPENEEQFKQNASHYKKELEEMDQYAKEQIATIPEESRVLVTAHDAFNYFGNAYGLEVMGLQGLSTDSEYGLKDVQALVDTIVKRNIKAVFVESSISGKSIQAVVEGAKKQNHNVVIGGNLYSDAMGEEGTDEGTYIGMFKHNVDTIVSSLK